jgi:hypothetical protein
LAEAPMDKANTSTGGVNLRFIVVDNY